MTDYKIIKTRIIDMLTDSECEDKRLLEYIYQELQNEGIGWIPVSERLPDYSIHVYAYLGHLANSANIMKLVRQYDNTWRNVAGWEYTGITHWQPLPSGPKEAT